MKTMRFVFVLGFTLIFVLSIAGLMPKEGNALDFQMVKVRSLASDDAHKLQVAPDPVEVIKGTVVIWLNSIEGREIKVSFEEGKRCADVTSGASGFSYDSACYVTTWVPTGGTTSLQFDEAGTFEYSVASEGLPDKKGKIIVQESH
jgi:hypothetical protein